ncbi:right-handed parallel beta-helix repeat-containing protein [Gillisia sp. M10.2A]|uniref:Right-handed parallel beta-helix repeat-containing protein n=1 Tax=Gillisia lutea TaxID=2909668 RepID=A0ABS9EDV7_9FLAO|nr:right-handed parallel beta-helix repeat-containing protein [Gillisia lutea]MCF4101074.1 right-handed parallel beta-helix repeat-containing protein [Gillisia lutea]
MKIRKTYLFVLLLISIIGTSCSADESSPDLKPEIPETGSNPDLEHEVSSAIYVATTAELFNAISNASAGDSIVVKAGMYILNSKVIISNSGEAHNKIYLIGDDFQERPAFDFSGMSENSSNQGIILSGSNWHIKGIDISGAGDNGMKIEGSNNLIEFCTFSRNADTGLQIDSGASNNRILNCDSFFNADSSIENADGFACKLTAGTGNKFIGCRAWNNLDDGWDGYLRGSDDITTTYENCWAFRNGYLGDGTKGGGDGNGFKTGGSDDKTLKHNAIYSNCLAVGNLYDGFDHNSNRGEVTIYNCSAFANGTNYNFSSTNPLAKLTIKNSLALGTKGNTLATQTNISNNSWQLNVQVSEEDFQSLDVEQLLLPRKSDGSLPDVTFMHLVSESDLIDKGVDVGLSFNGEAPDLGTFEFGN